MYPEKSLTALSYVRTHDLFIETTTIDEKRTKERDQHGSKRSRLDSTTSITYAFGSTARITESYRKYLHLDWLFLRHAQFNALGAQVDYGRNSS